MPTLTIHRQSEWMNRFRVVKIYSNGELLGVVPNNSSRDFQLEIGNHSVEARIDWCGSEPIPLRFSENSHHEINIKGPKFEKLMMFVSTLVGLIIAFYMITDSVSKLLFFTGLIPIVGYRLYYFTLGRNSFIQTQVI